MYGKRPSITSLSSARQAQWEDHFSAIQTWNQAQSHTVYVQGGLKMPHHSDFSLRETTRRERNSNTRLRTERRTLLFEQNITLCAQETGINIRACRLHRTCVNSTCIFKPVWGRPDWVKASKTCLRGRGSSHSLFLAFSLLSLAFGN
jgi:hypothetical protein